MTMKEAVISVFENYANFSGRARRSEYWYFVLFDIVAPVAVLTALSLFGGSERLLGLVSSAYYLGTFIPRLALIWRRLHDINKSGPCFFWILFPVAGIIMFLIWMCREGTYGPNRYGPDPRESAFRAGKNPWEY